MQCENGRREGDVQMSGSVIGWIILAVFLVGIFSIVQLFRYVYNSTHESKTARKNVYSEKQESWIAFYEKCLERNVRDLRSWANFQKAKEIAKELDLAKFWVDVNWNAEDAFKNYFEDAKEFYENNLEMIMQKKLEGQKAEERQMEEKLTQYADYTGIQKRIAMLSEQEKKYRDGANLLYEYSTSLVGGSQQKEYDWAVIGGLVSGPLGGAAGVAAAADAQMRNAEVRAQNARNLERIANSITNVYDAAEKLTSKADDLHGKIYDAEYKEVIDMPEDDIMEMLSFENSKVQVRETGSFSVNVSVGYNKKPDPVDGKTMVVDGTIAVELYQDGEYVETALLVLPAYGLTDECDLTGICCAEADPSKPCEVKYVPYRLWLVEK